MESKRNQLIEQACRFIEKNNGDVSLARIAEHVMASPYHFHRLFKSIMGITPKDYANAYRQKLIKKRWQKMAVLQRQFISQVLMLIAVFMKMQPQY